MRRRVMALAILFCLCLCVFGSAVTEESPPAFVFSWWGDAWVTQATREGIQRFQKETKTPLVIEERSFDDREEYLRQLFASRSASSWGDLWELDAEMLHLLAKNENGAFQLADMETFSGQIDLSQFSYLGLSGCVVDGQLCAVPISMTSHVFFWNQTGLKERKYKAPTDTDTLLALADSLEQGVYPLAADAQSRMVLMITYLQSKYGQLWIDEESGFVSFTLEQIAEGMAYLQRFDGAGVWPPISAQGDLTEGFLQGRYLGLWAWDTLSVEIALALPKKNKWETTASLSDWSPYAGGFQKVSRMLAIPKGAQNPQMSAELIEFLLNSEKGARILKDLRGTPVSTKALASCKKGGLLDKARTQANQTALSWARYPMPHELNRIELIGSGGIYEQVLLGLSSGAMTHQAAAAALLSGMRVVWYPNE